MNFQASLCSKPLEIYNFMYKNSLCTTLADLYVHWAWELEQAGNYKRAEQVSHNFFQTTHQSQCK